VQTSTGNNRRLKITNYCSHIRGEL